MRVQNSYIYSIDLGLGLWIGTCGIIHVWSLEGNVLTYYVQGSYRYSLVSWLLRSHQQMLTLAWAHVPLCSPMNNYCFKAKVNTRFLSIRIRYRVRILSIYCQAWKMDSSRYGHGLGDNKPIERRWERWNNIFSPFLLPPSFSQQSEWIVDILVIFAGIVALVLLVELSATYWWCTPIVALRRSQSASIRNRAV